MRTFGSILAVALTLAPGIAFAQSSWVGPTPNGRLQLAKSPRNARHR